MRRTIPMLALLLAGSLPSAHAGEETKTKPTTASTLEQVAALDVATTEAHVHCHAGVLAALVERCPQLVALGIVCNTTLPLEDLRLLQSLEQLRRLTLTGDMPFPTSHFEVVGGLKSLTALRMSLY
jgi:hypothetical protein